MEYCQCSCGSLYLKSLYKGKVFECEECGNMVSGIDVINSVTLVSKKDHEQRMKCQYLQNILVKRDNTIKILNKQVTSLLSEKRSIEDELIYEKNVLIEKCEEQAKEIRSLQNDLKERDDLIDDYAEKIMKYRATEPSEEFIRELQDNLKMAEKSFKEIYDEREAMKKAIDSLKGRLDFANVSLKTADNSLNTQRNMLKEQSATIEGIKALIKDGIIKWGL